jgi:hypothetical protein
VVGVRPRAPTFNQPAVAADGERLSQKQYVLSVPAPILSGCEPTAFMFDAVQQLAKGCKVTIPDKSGIRTSHNAEKKLLGQTRDVCRERKAACRYGAKP